MHIVLACFAYVESQKRALAEVGRMGFAWEEKANWVVDVTGFSVVIVIVVVGMA